MSEVKRGLGRGLSALLGEVAREEPVAAGETRSAGVQMLPVAEIRANPDQPRRFFDDAALDELAASISARGLIQPIVVRPHAGGYQIVAGERRWRAAQRAQLHSVPALIKPLDDAETLELAIVENIQRQDLNAIEEAEAYQRLGDIYGHTQEALARIVGKSRSHVANLLRLLELPPTVRGAVAAGQLSMGQARAIATAPDVALLAEEVIRRGLSVRATEALVRKRREPTPASRRPADPAGDADARALERHLADLLGVRVALAYAGEGGSLTLTYSTLDQLDMICQRLTGGAI